jgi:hypothetical protein
MVLCYSPFQKNSYFLQAYKPAYLMSNEDWPSPNNGGGILRANKDYPMFKNDLCSITPPTPSQKVLTRNQRKRRRNTANNAAKAHQLRCEIPGNMAKEIVRLCSLGQTGIRSKHRVKSGNKATYRLNKNNKYKGGAWIYSKAQGKWTKASSWIKKPKFM